jgi:hypothetical protein
MIKIYSRTPDPGTRWRGSGNSHASSFVPVTERLPAQGFAVGGDLFCDVNRSGGRAPVRAADAADR